MSNPTLSLLEQRRSERNFTGETIPEADLQAILQAAQQAPTSVNGQQVSLVVVRNKETIATIAELAGGQPQVATADTFIAIVIDYQRPAEAARLVSQPMVIDSSAEGLMVGAVDAGIMLQALQTAASALGYGTTAIGAVRRDPQAMTELLGLPPRTFVAVGTTLGVIDKSKQGQVKPRVPLGSFAFRERYDLAAMQQGVAQYDATLRQWWDQQGLTEMPSYAAATAGYYRTIYFPQVAATLTRQGFAFKDE